MFDPKLLVSPASALLETLRRENDINYQPLLTEENVEVVSIKPAYGEYNTLATINQLGGSTTLTKTSKSITYDRVNVAKIVADNAKVVTNLRGLKEQHLIDPSTYETIRTPTLEQYVSTLTNYYDVNLNVHDLIVDGESYVGREPNYTSRNVNGTERQDLYTYSDGYVGVNHRDILPDNPKAEPSKMELGLQVYKPILRNESIDIVLPAIETNDHWIMLVETVEEARYTNPGIPWFKLACLAGSDSWVLHMPEKPPISFDSRRENTISLTAIDNTISVSGLNVEGASISAEYQNDLAFPDYGMLGLTFYTQNPLPSLMQFTIANQVDDEDITPMMSRTATVDGTKHLITNPLSNGIFGQSANPVIITDVKTVNYLEDNIHRFIDKSVIPRYQRGKVTRTVQTYPELSMIVECTLGRSDGIIHPLSKYVSEGLVKSIEMQVIDVNDPSNTLKYTNRFINYNPTAKTYTLIKYHNDVEVARYDNHSIIYYNNIKAYIAVDSIAIQASTGNTLKIPTPVSDKARVYEVHYLIEFNQPVVLPEVSVKKTATDKDNWR